MQLAEVSIRRPVFATVLSLLILLIGAVSYTRLAVREYPKIDEPVVTVSVRYAGASAEVIETQVTKPLEDSIAGIDAVDVLTSISRPEQAQISKISSDSTVANTGRRMETSANCMVRRSACGGRAAGAGARRGLSPRQRRHHGWGR